MPVVLSRVGAPSRQRLRSTEMMVQGAPWACWSTCSACVFEPPASPVTKKPSPRSRRTRKASEPLNASMVRSRSTTMARVGVRTRPTLCAERMAAE